MNAEGYCNEEDVANVESTMTRRAGSAHADRKMEEEIANAPLERQKFRLLHVSSRDKKTCAELDVRIAAARRLLMERKMRLSNSNALFMTMPDAVTKAPRQRLGAADAVMATKRIIDRELLKVQKETAIMTMKLNKAKAKNNAARAQIEAARKDAMTFNRLFGAMQEELTGLQSRIREVKVDIEEGYDDRSAALEDMRNLTKQFEVDKLERQQEWQVFSDAIEKANNEGIPEHMESASGLLTQAEEDELRKKIKRGHTKMQKDRSLLQNAQAKLVVYKNAIQSVRDATGYDDLQDVVDLFERYEEEKFAKVGAATRLVADIERAEKEVAAARSEANETDSTRSRIKESRAALLASLTAQAEGAEAVAKAERDAAQSTHRELKSLARVIEFAFRAIGADAAVDPGLHALEHEELTLRAAASAAASAAAAEALSWRQDRTDTPNAAPSSSLSSPSSAADAAGSSSKPSGMPSRSRSNSSSGGFGGKPFVVAALSLPPSSSAAASSSAADGDTSSSAPAPLRHIPVLISQSSVGGGLGMGGVTGLHSPIRSRSLSMSMYATNGVAQEVAAGVGVGSLSKFVGLLESRAADIIHMYAAHKTQESEVASAAAANAQAEEAALAAALSSTSPNNSVILPHTSRAGGDSTSRTTETRGQQHTGLAVQGSITLEGGGEGGEGGSSLTLGGALGADAAAKRSTANAVAAAIGPPNPTGRLKESLAAATIAASLLDASRLVSATSASSTTTSSAAAGGGDSSSAGEGAAGSTTTTTGGRRGTLGGGGVSGLTRSPSKMSSGSSGFGTSSAQSRGASRQSLTGSTRQRGGVDALISSSGAAAAAAPNGEGEAGPTAAAAASSSGVDAAASLRPLSIDEIKRQAAASMTADKSVKAVRAAAAVAATALTMSS